MHNPVDISKRRRVDPKLFISSEGLAKQEPKIGDEEISIEEFDYQEITDQDYEIVYESNLTVNDEINESKKISTQKRKSKNLTFREKYQIIQLIDNGISVPMITENYGIGRTTVYDIIKRRQDIFDFVEKSDDAERKTFKKSSFPAVEERVLKWCDSRESFTKHDFYNRAKSAFENARDQGLIASPSGFCGSWSWAKRFFHRHPDLKRKLRTVSGDPIDPLELSLTNTEFLEENSNYKTSQDEPTRIKMEQDQQPAVDGKRIKFLNLSEKLQVLDEIDAGKPVASISEKYGASKTTIYDIFKRRQELRDTKLTKSNSMRKVIKQPRYPQVELELLRWCLKQKNYPLRYVLIADKASCIFDTLGIKGTFNPTSWWAKKFVMRHPELLEKQGISCDDDITDEPNIEETVQDVSINEQETEDDVPAENFMLMEDNGIAAEYQEEYIVEALDSQHDDELEIEAVTEVKHEPDSDNMSDEIDTLEEEETPSITFIPDQIALKSLKILIKFSEQRGHKHMLDCLVDYQRELQENR